MRKYLIAVCIMCCCAALVACSDDDKLPNVQPDAQGTFTDERDGNAYGWIRIGDLEWMTSNLKYGTPYYERTFGGIFLDSEGNPQSVATLGLDYLPLDLAGDFEKYGNLYSWEEIEEIVPEGWRVASDEDWKNLEKALGMSLKEADKEGWRGGNVATLMMQKEEGTGFALQLSGCAWQNGAYDKDIHLNSVNEYGYFWTSTEDKDNELAVSTVWFRKIFATQSTVYRGTSPLDILMRVRCCRDAQK